MGKQGKMPHKEPRQAGASLTAERYLRKAVDALRSTERSSKKHILPSPAVLETLFRKPSSVEFPNFSTEFFTEDYYQELAAYQIDQIHRMLTQKLELQNGFAESGIIMLNLLPESRPYTMAALTAIARQIAGNVGSDGENPFVELVCSRFFGVTADGVSRIEVEEREARAVFRQQLEWHKENRALFGIQDENLRLVETHGEHAPVAVVLGCLPLIDEFDLAPALCGQHVISGNMPAGRAERGSLMKSTTEILRSGREFLLSTDEYWTYYSKYLSKFPTSEPRVGIAPLNPGEYRTLLEERQAVRDARLRLLSPYTGRRRKTAAKYEVLAAHYPLFFLLAEEFIRQAGCGVASLISPSTFLLENDAEPMRKHLCESFNSITITENSDLDGEDSCGKFAVSTMAKTRAAHGRPLPCEVWHMTNPFGTELRPALIQRTPPELDVQYAYASVMPSEKNGYSLRPPEVSEEYLSWPSIVGIYDIKLNGLMEKRGGSLHDTDRDALASRMQAYFDRGIAWNDYAAMERGLTKKQSRFDPKATRDEVRRREQYATERIRPYVVKPFDIRWCYYTATRPIWHDPRPELEELQRGGNNFLVVRSNQAVEDEGVPFYFTDCLGDSDLLREHAYFIPTWFASDAGKRTVNLSSDMQAYLSALGVTPILSLENAALLVHHHVLAIAFAPAYLHENGIGLGQGWPRIPFPKFDVTNQKPDEEACGALYQSAELGKQIAALLQGGEDATGGHVTDCFATLHEPAEAHSREGDARFYTVNKRWGKLSSDEAVLPSHGKLSVRGYTIDEREALEAVACSMGVHAGAAYSLLGETTRDIYLNKRVHLMNIPAKVWEFTVGGYQVIKKWLSYRETEILGRPLRRKEMDELHGMVRRIARIKLLGFHLNHNYAAIRALHAREPVSLKMP